jgi:ABC-type nitrate/sulfonate/bicarbonate transport system permease component
MGDFRRPSLDSGWAVRTSFFIGCVIGLVAGLLLGAVNA